MLDQYYKASKEIKNNFVENSEKPVVYTPSPSQNDYRRGFIRRYFIQTRDNRQKIIEVDKRQYQTLNVYGKGLSSKFYKSFVIDWKITGPRNDIYNGKVPILNGVENTNRNIVQLREENYPGIAEYLDDPLEFWEERIQ